jgi:hypothetical protein
MLRNFDTLNHWKKDLWRFYAKLRNVETSIYQKAKKLLLEQALRAPQTRTNKYSFTGLQTLNGQAPRVQYQYKYTPKTICPVWWGYVYKPYHTFVYGTYSDPPPCTIVYRKTAVNDRVCSVHQEHLLFLEVFLRWSQYWFYGCTVSLASDSGEEMDLTWIGSSVLSVDWVLVPRCCTFFVRGT